MAREADQHAQDMRLRPLLSLSAQRQGLRMEPQAGASDLSRAGTQPADQAEEEACQGKARAPGRSCSTERDLVDGLHVRPTRGWSQLPHAQSPR